jgi:hypothetical protein
VPGRVAHGTYVHDLGRRHPFEVLLLLAGMVVGFSRVVIPSPLSVSMALPPTIVVVWHLLMGVGSLIGLVGIMWKDPLTGLLVERAGLWFLSAGGGAYALALFSVGLRAVPAACFVVSFAVACLLRAIDIARVLRRLRRVTLTVREVDGALRDAGVVDEGVPDQ